MADNIRDGRAALQAGQPRQARALFAAALAHPDGNRADAFAAAIGLGRSALWLGDYPAAATAFRMARQQASDEPGRQAADTGLAQALNAQDYPHAAYALVAPFASGQPRPTLELMRAMQALGWQDKSPAYLQAGDTPGGDGYFPTRYRLLQDDMHYALAPRVEGRFGYSHDSEQLDTWTVGAAYRFAPRSGASLMQRWGVAADTTRVTDGTASRRVDSAALLGQLRIGDDHAIDLDLGMGRSGSWQYLQGALRWTLQPTDRFSLSTAAERAPIPSDRAIAHRLIHDTYSLATSLRPATHWYVVPAYYRQNFSDGNHRDGGSLRVLLSPYDIPGTSGALGAQLSTRLFHASQPSRGVYFNPAHYRATQLGLIGVYGFSPRWKLRATADVGRQVIDGQGAGIYAVNLSLEGRLPHNGRFTLDIGRSSVASASGGGAGYWSDTATLSISYPF
jgi:hypothetical protein